MRFREGGLLAAAFVLLASGGCAGTGGTGASIAAPLADLELRATGAGNWDIECVAITKRGEAKSRLKGRGATSTDTLFIRDVVSASCAYTTGDSPVTLNLTEDGIACPSGEFQSGLCSTLLPENADGTIDFASL